LVNDANSSNLTADLNTDGIPDMFQEGSTIDVNAWQYEKATNETINWYRMRFAPEFVASSIQVYDENGGSHILETRFLRTGTRSVTNGSNIDRYNGWDMMINLKPEDGVLVDDLVTGIQFDEQGRFLGSANLGSTVHGTALADSNIYVGTPIDDSIQVNWATTGTATMSMDLGQANSTTGLTGFGTSSTGAAINQDGNANGELQTLSVQPNGNIVGLYSNGKSLPLYQIQIAVFSNSAGLTNSGGNLWKVSSNSGDPIIREPGTAGSGTLTPGVLEGSNVDIASEFTRLITAQRGFQVNARVIQTTDSILQELATLIR
jgi:flagellar hook protein FlgE